jgi:DNA-binding protein H-NS
MKSLVELQSEIETLTAQASELRAKEFDRTLKEIAATMKAFGITLADVRDALQSVAKGKAKSKAKGKTPAKRGRKPKAETAKKAAKPKSSGGARKPAPIKFRGPNGEAWSGRGKLPKWLKAATDAGQSVDAFRV